MNRTILSLIILLQCCLMPAAEPFVIFGPADDALSLREATVSVDGREHRCVRRATETLLRDLEQVTGVRPALNASARPTILIGTVGCNRQVDQWVRQGVLNDLKGKTEKYIIQTVGDQLVIAGSDKRGTVFGIYEFSRQIGVSPWYWWADVPIERHEQISVRRGSYTDGEPAVRYRGIFLNDEAPSLTSWVKHAFGTDYGDHRFYERVFELILRLKGNFMWPAMWGWAFYADDSENSRTADEMGIIMGTSHHEPMARNHQEWVRHRQDYGPWNYQANQQVIDRFFREGVRRMRQTDDIVTIGMRGDGDEAMSDEADTRLLERIVRNQRKIIEQETGRKARETPQVWALYKEVLDYYDKGMRVPEDVTILLCDDNWGNVRRVPTAKRQGGWGLYYHVDYVGAPRNTKWLNVTPSQHIWEQLSLAYAHGIDRMWILNVGDLKPMEYPITLFMDMAWRPESVTRDVVASHTEPFCRELFGREQAAEAARILDLQGRYAGRSTAEMLDHHTYDVESGEWQRVADEYMRLEAEALRQYLQIAPDRRDAYQELILFPVQAMSNLYQLYFATAMNHWLAARHDPDANRWAQQAREAFRRDSLLCRAYNHDIAGGKWQGMMTQKHIGYTTWNDDFPEDRLPLLYEVGEGVGGYTFTARDGYASMEAEHYYRATTDGTLAEWTVLPGAGRTRSGMTLMPYTEPTGQSALTYRFSLGQQTADSLRIHVIVKSTLDYLNQGGLTYTLQLDSLPPVRVCFNSLLNERPENIYSVFYPTVARRVVETVVAFPAPTSSTLHTLTFHPDDPAIVLEKIVVDAGGYRRQHLFGRESPVSREADWQK